MFIYLGSNTNAFWKHLWAILTSYYDHLGRLWSIWQALGIILESLEARWTCIKVFQGHFGIILEYLGAILGPFASVLGSLLQPRAAISTMFGF